MDFNIHSLLIIFFLVVPLARPGSAIKHQGKQEAYTYEQALDHFSFAAEGSPTFKQRYFVEKTSWAGPQYSAPIFVCLGGEDNILSWLKDRNCETMNQNAPRFKALLLYLEHRYYGESMPNIMDDLVINPTTFGYLTSEQAMADYVAIITHVKAKLSAENSPVILFGASYSGTVWLRLKYPHIIVGALASSAPVFSDDERMPPFTYDKTVTRIFREESESCYNTIKNSWIQLDSVANGFEENGLHSLSKAFNTCNKLKHIDQLRIWLIEKYKSAATVSEEVRDICKAIDGIKGIHIMDDIKRIAAGAKTGYDNECLPIGGSRISAKEHSRPGQGHSSREHFTQDEKAWDWQKCTEQLFPFTGQAFGRVHNSMFPLHDFSIQAHSDYCNREYGVRPRAFWASTEFGGIDLRRVLKSFGSNIIFTNGLRDLWSSFSVLENLSESIVALTTEMGDHCQDTQRTEQDDPIWLKNQRSKAIDIINKWIVEYNHNLNLPSI